MEDMRQKIGFLRCEKLHVIVGVERVFPPRQPRVVSARRFLGCRRVGCLLLINKYIIGFYHYKLRPFPPTRNTDLYLSGRFWCHGVIFSLYTGASGDFQTLSTGGQVPAIVSILVGDDGRDRARVSTRIHDHAFGLLKERLATFHGVFELFYSIQKRIFIQYRKCIRYRNEYLSQNCSQSASEKTQQSMYLPIELISLASISN